MDYISRYIEDKRFIQWVFQPTDELEKWWESFREGNPGDKKNIQLARKVLLNLKTIDKSLSEDDRILLFSRILKDIELKEKNRKTYPLLIATIKYAAVAILFFSIGALLFYQKDNFNPIFYSQNLEEPVADNEAKLIRPDGENILLDDKKSVIEYTEDGNVKVNNSTYKPIEDIKKERTKLNQLIIPYGKTSELLLPDGTRVFLNAGSRLVYPEFFNDKNREVFLVGEAYFNVTEDKDHPFIVQTTDIRIKVLGTQFNVSAYPSDNIIETVLTEGKVLIDPNNSGFFDESTTLVPNQLASFNKINREIRLSNVNTDNYTLWKQGLYNFQHTDLSRIIKKLERYYNIRFHYKNPLQGTIKISGKLELNENKDEIINRVAVAASVGIVKIGESAYEIN